MIQIAASVLLSIGLILGSLNIPAKYISYAYWTSEKSFGNVGFTTLNSTDNLIDFPSRWNTDIAALDNGKIDVGTTSVASITTLANLVSIGTVITGVWDGTAIAVAKGCTGTTTPESNYVMLGD